MFEAFVGFHVLTGLRVIFEEKTFCLVLPFFFFIFLYLGIPGGCETQKAVATDWCNHSNITKLCNGLNPSDFILAAEFTLFFPWFSMEMYR